MATFPAIDPVTPAPKEVEPTGTKMLLGDGYEVALRFGLNNVRPEWRLKWEVRETDAVQIDTFLQARANAGEAFDWQPPDSASALRWRCEEWTVTQEVHNWYSLTATFKRVFELS